MIKNKFTVVLTAQGTFSLLAIEEVPFTVKGTSLVKAQQILKELNNA